MAAGLFSDAITPYALPAINFVSSQTNNKYNLLPAYGNKGYLTVTSPNTIVASDSSTFIGSNATDGVIHIDSNNDIIIQADSNLNINANNAYIDAVNEMLIDGKAVYVNADSSINMQANEEIILSSSIDLTIQGLTNTYVLPGTQGIKFDNTHKGIMSFIADTISTSIAAILPQQSGDVVINASPFDGCGDFDIVSVTPNTLGNSSIPSYVQVTAGNLGSGLIQLRLFNGSTATTLGADNYGFTISCIGIKY
jgi:hypothetical protein